MYSLFGIANGKVSDTKKTPQVNKENVKKEKNIEPEYYDISCPHCDNVLSIDKNIEYKDGFTCPYCDGKIDV